MRTNDYGEMIWSESDLFDLVMQGHDVRDLSGLCIDTDIDPASLCRDLEQTGQISTWHRATDPGLGVPEYDRQQQSCWHMPPEYRDMDIVQHVLDLCQNDVELQRVGQELLMYQERDMMDVLRYMKYLVDVMTQNRIIWGVGRGSSTASFVLYLLGVHRINSIEYDLDPGEFLR